MSIEYVKVKDIFKITKGKKVEQVEQGKDNTIRCIQIDDLRNDKNIKYCNKNGNYVLAKKDDVIIAWDGANAGTIGYGLEGAIGSTLAILTSKKQSIKSEFAGLYLRSRSKYLREKCTGATIPHISRSSLEEIEIPCFDISIQMKIVQVIMLSQELIDKRKAQIEALDELIKSVFYDMFGDLVTNKREWREDSINKVCLEIVDCVNRTAPIVKYQTDYKMVRTGNVKNGYIDTINVDYVDYDTYTKWTRRLTPLKGDILFTREAPTGHVGLIRTDEKIFLGQRIMHYRTNKNKILPLFLLYHLLDKSMEIQINKLATGSTVKHLSVDDCKEFIIKIPPIELQKKFSSVIESIEREKLLLQQSLSQLETNFNCIMQKAFKGELFN